MPYDIDPNLEKLAIRKGYGGNQRRGLTQAIDLANLNTQPSLVQNIAAPGNPSDGNANASWHSRREYFEKQQELMRQQMAEAHEKKHPTVKVQDHIPVLPRGVTPTPQSGNSASAPVALANQERINQVFKTLFSDSEFISLYKRLSVENDVIVIDASGDVSIRIFNANHAFIRHCVQHYSRLFENEVFPLSPEQFFSSLLISLFKDVSSEDFLETLRERELEKNVSSTDFIDKLKDDDVSLVVTSQESFPTEFDQLPDLASKVSASYTPPVPQASSYASYSQDIDITALEDEAPHPQATPALVAAQDLNVDVPIPTVQTNPNLPGYAESSTEELKPKRLQPKQKKTNAKKLLKRKS